MGKNLLSDPNINYDTMERTNLNSNEKYLPSKTVRFNKYKHKLSVQAQVIPVGHPYDFGIDTL